jgi:heme-degrading monooxygenase HmoA
MRWFCPRLCVLLPLMCKVSSLLNNNLSKSHGQSFSLDDTSVMPASRKVLLDFQHVDNPDNGRKSFDPHAKQPSSLRFATYLKRRDGLSLYGREIEHSELDANCATLAFFENTPDANDQIDPQNAWDATLFLGPEQEHFLQESDQKQKKCFVAMNRFDVKEHCKQLFEERWSERKSKLPFQPGFLGFSLLRRSGDYKQKHLETSVTLNDGETGHDMRGPFNYSTCTIWDTEQCWEGWRSGEGRSSHESSRNTKRVPVAEWLESPSSPIFWEGEIIHGVVP